MNANLNQRPTANELYDKLYFWWNSVKYYEYYKDVEKYGYCGKEINI